MLSSLAKTILLNHIRSFHDRPNTISSHGRPRLYSFDYILDRIYSSFFVLVIAYGGATMNPTGKGELSVPVKYIYKKCSERYTTRKVDEKYLTLMHFKCQKTTIAVRKEYEYTRGLRWCPTCRELVCRDKNACKNIGMVFQSEERPRYLCDTYDREMRKCYLELLSKKVNSHTPTITGGIGF